MFISNKQKFREAVAAAIRAAVSVTDGTKSRRFNAIQKAAEEIKNNDSMQFDAASGCLSFVSLESGKPRRVTRYGCSDLCECQNKISYHRAALRFSPITLRPFTKRPRRLPNTPPASFNFR